MAVTDLTGTTWYFNNTLTFPLFSDAINIDFNYTDGEIPDSAELLYFENNILYYDGEDAYYSIGGGWTNQVVRTINITGGVDSANATVIAWFEANATQVVLSDPFTITYNNSEIYSTAQDGTVTLPCANKLMASDITVTGSDVYSVNINYNGSTITTASGSFTKTLPCAGKVMATDVTISVVISTIIYTFENGELTISNAPYEFSGGELTI